MSEESNKNWHNINVNRNRKYSPLVDKLCSMKSSHQGKSIFDFNKDLMVFAAVVGYSNNKKEAVELKSQPIHISLGTYSSDEKDGYIYLLALLETQQVESLKDAKILGSVEIFEKYCNGGLSIIQSWMDDKPGDIEGVDTLAEMIFDQLVTPSVEDNVDVREKEVEL